MDARNKAVITVTDPNTGTVPSVTDPNKEQTPCGFVPRKHTRLQMEGAYPALRGGVCDESGGEVLLHNDSYLPTMRSATPSATGNGCTPGKRAVS